MQDYVELAVISRDLLQQQKVIYFIAGIKHTMYEKKLIEKHQTKFKGNLKMI
jgi:hypothetical protein